jgi:hypothetical protein
MSSRSLLALLVPSALLWSALPACGEEAASNEGPTVIVAPGNNKGGSSAGGSSAGGSSTTGGQGGTAGFPAASGAGGSGAGAGGSGAGSGATGGAGGSDGGAGGNGAGDGGSAGDGGGGGTETSGAGGDAGQGGSGSALPCHPGFSFSPAKQKAGVPFQVTFTDPTPYPWISMEASGPGAPVVSDQVINGAGPYAWSYTVSGHQQGVLELRFYKDKPPGSPGVLVGTCQRQVQAGPGGQGGSGGSGAGSGGSAGTGGSGAGTGGSGPVGESCTTPIEMVSGPSGTYFVLDFNCPQLELVQSPIFGSPPSQTSYRSTLGKWLTDYNGAKDIAFAFNTNFSQTNADPITGAYVYNSTIYQTVYLTNCVEAGGCPTSCFLEGTRYSVGVGGDGKPFELAYNPPYTWAACQAMGCQGCKDLNWNTNMPIKWPVGTSNGIIPGGTRWLVSGFDIETGMESHNGKPDPFSEWLGNRNVMAKVNGKNKVVVGLLQGASRKPVKDFMTGTFGVGQIIVFDGGGSTKQYISYQGNSHDLDGSRAVPGILGFRVK